MWRNLTVLIISTAIFGGAACRDSTQSNLEERNEFERAQLKTYNNAKRFQNDRVQKSSIIVFGQVQADEKDIHLITVEYLKAPLDIRARSRLSLGEGVEPGRNIPALNKMALVYFDENMTILGISESRQGSKFYNEVRHIIHEQKTNK